MFRLKKASLELAADALLEPIDLAKLEPKNPRRVWTQWLASEAGDTLLLPDHNYSILYFSPDQRFIFSPDLDSYRFLSFFSTEISSPPEDELCCFKHKQMNWRAQSKNDPLIFRPFLKVSTCQNSTSSEHFQKWPITV